MPAPDMALPEGRTCRDCLWWPTCSGLISTLTGDERTCDWSPSRFVHYDDRDNPHVRRMRGKTAARERMVVATP